MTEPLGRAGSTLHVRYHIDPALGVDEPELNRKIRRFAPAAGARSREADPVFVEPTGRITVPVLAIHETGDARVPFSLQQPDRAHDIAPAIDMIYRGPALVAFLLGLLLLAIGSITFAGAIWRSAVLPRWAGVLFAIGLTLWFPPFPRVIRILDGFVIGLGGVWLAMSLRQKT